MIQIRPSLLAANPINLEHDIEDMLSLGLNAFHIDMLDYQFAPNFGLSIDCCRSILKRFPNVHLDVHLMMNPTPIHIIESLLEIGIQDISIHLDTLSDTDREKCLSLKDVNIRIAVRPEEPLDHYQMYPRLLLLAVSPGFSGQRMESSVLDKALAAHKLGIDVLLDGGINLSTIQSVMQAKPNTIVIGGGLVQQPKEQQVKLLNQIKDLQG